MINQPRHLALFAVIAAALLPAAGAQAQNHGASVPPAPLYPYAVQDQQPDAVERKRAPIKRAGRGDNTRRVFQADAEITIHGSDRMSIRLFRKGSLGKANARVE